jgi:hypothetical protein
VKLDQFEPQIKAVGEYINSPHPVLTQVSLIVEGAVKPYVPVLTGNLRRSIHSRVEAQRAYVGTNVGYAVYVHEGTAFMAARPFLDDGLDASMQRVSDALVDWGFKALKKVK